MFAVHLYTSPYFVCTPRISFVLESFKNTKHAPYGACFVFSVLESAILTDEDW
jgi:hypothetical protein